MFRLQTVFPLGLNSRIKGLGTVNHEGRYKAFNLYSLSVCFDRNARKKKRQRKKRNHKQAPREEDSTVPGAMFD